MSCGGGGPGQAHCRHHQVIVMVRVAHRLARSFPWCSIALCNCIDHHIRTGTEKKKQKKTCKKNLQARLAALLAFPASLLPHRRGACHGEPLDATRLWGCYPLIALPTTYYCIVLCCVSRQWVAQLYSGTAMCLPGHLGGRQDIRSRSPGHEKCRRPGELGLSTLSWDVDLV